MKYFRIFSHTSAYTEYMASSDAIVPNVSYCYGDNRTYITDGSMPPPTPKSLMILGMSSISGESCSYNAIYDGITDVTSSATWSIILGFQYATIDSSNGEVTILSNANNSQVLIQVSYNGTTATKEITLTYSNGSSSETTTEITTDSSGNTTTVTTTVTTNEDGSTSENIQSNTVDAEGNPIGSSETNKQTNSDSSYTESTTNYDAEGNAVDGSNVTGDTDGNVNTQSVEYDESGNSIVVGYEIDTSGSESGAKSYSGDGVNTEYYAFDLTHGFVLNIEFTINFNAQPPGQNENHHNILTMKRATPEPWYGFQLRHSSTNKVIALGTQFASGGNTNTNISGTATETANLMRYNLRITYDPTAATNKFVCRNMITETNVFSKNDTFPDIPELRYLKVTIGYAMDENGEPYRYSNINVLNFNIQRL